MAHWIPLLRMLSCFLILSRVAGNLNLFMNDDEVERLLGLLETELYYVRDGEVKYEALKFELLVPSSVDSLNFTWFTTTKTQVFYSMELTSDDPHILSPPSVNIALDGEVPKTESVFQIALTCTGKQPGPVGLLMQLNLTLHSVKNITTLNLKRKKFCMQDERYKPPEGITDTTTKDGVTSGNSSVSVSGKMTSSAVTTSVFYIAVGVACGTICLIAMIVAFIYVQAMKTSDRTSETSSSVHAPHHQHNHNHSKGPNYSKIGNNVANNMNGSMCNSLNRFYPVNELKTADFKTKLKEIAVERSQLTLGDVLHEGTFGRVYHGYVVMSTNDSESQHEEELEVFVKTVTDQASEEQRSLLIKESCLLHGIVHQTILPILHVCLDDDKQPMMVFEYMNHGNLKHFLKNGRISDAHQGLSTRDLVLIAIQITRGMQYLGKLRIIHRDLATRNCVIDEDYNVKITDNALARDLFPQDYTCLGDNENRPVKWLAIESLIDKKYSTSSDVWAFGVTLWELMTLGQTPYADVDPFEMASYLKNGYRMAQPPNCPDELFSVMACCWALSPIDRPKFTHLATILNDFHRALGIYI
ncbi:tyrosine-protein kinase RYK-like [Glandiceps talaboti]